MKQFGKWLTEAKDKSVTFTFGRFNPPTTGHAKLVEKLRKVRADDIMLFTSHSTVSYTHLTLPTSDLV